MPHTGDEVGHLLNVGVGHELPPGPTFIIRLLAWLGYLQEAGVSARTAVGRKLRTPCPPPNENPYLAEVKSPLVMIGCLKRPSSTCLRP